MKEIHSWSQYTQLLIQCKLKLWEGSMVYPILSDLGSEVGSVLGRETIKEDTAEEGDCKPPLLLICSESPLRRSPCVDCDLTALYTQVKALFI